MRRNILSFLAALLWVSSAWAQNSLPHSSVNPPLPVPAGGDVLQPTVSWTSANPGDVANWLKTYLNAIGAASTNLTNAVMPGSRDAVVGALGMSWRSPVDYGAKCDGVTDDTAAVLNAVAALTTYGAGSLMAPLGHSCAISQTILFQTSDVGVDCLTGAAANTTFTTSCGFKWIGPAGGTMFAYQATASPGIFRNFMNHVQLDCNAGVAATGLYTQSSFGFQSSGLTVQNCSGAYAVVLADLGSANLNNQVSKFENLTINELNPSGPGYISGGIDLQCMANSINQVYCSSFNTFINTTIVLPANISTSWPCTGAGVVKVPGTSCTIAGVHFGGGAGNWFRGGRFFGAGDISFDFDRYNNSTPTGIQMAGSDVVEDFLMQASPVNRGMTTYPGVSTTGTTHTSTTIDGIPSTAGMAVNNQLWGGAALGIPSNDYITAINGPTSITLNAPTTASATGNISTSCQPFTSVPGTEIALNTCAQNSQIVRGQITNGSQIPILEPGTQMAWSLTDGENFGQYFVGQSPWWGSIHMDSRGNLHTCTNDMLQYNGGSDRGGLWNCVTPQKPFELYDALGTDQWYWATSSGTPGALNFRLRHLMGTGSLVFDDALQVGNGLGLNRPVVANTIAMPTNSGASTANLQAGAAVPMGTVTPVIPGVSETLVAGYVASSPTDLVLTSNTSLNPIPNLGIAMQAGQTYNCHGHLTGSADAAGGVVITLAPSGGAPITATSIVFTGKLWSGTTLRSNTTNSSLNLQLAAFTGTWTDVDLDGTIVVNAAGTLNLDAGQNVSDASATTIKAGSYFNCFRQYP